MNSGNTPYTFTITRTGVLSGTTTANYAVSGAVDAADFGGTLPSGTVTFTAGQSSQVLTLNVSGDTTVEADEAFTVTLSNLVGANSFGTSTAAGTIVNDDTQVSIVATSASQNEGNSGNTPFTFTITRTGALSGTTTANYAVSGAADATDFGGTLPSGTVTFTAGQSSQVLTLNVSGDLTVEPDEVFTVDVVELGRCGQLRHLDCCRYDCQRR